MNFKINQQTLIVFSLGILFSSNILQARLASFNESDAVFKLISVKNEVHANGTYDEYYRSIIEIKKESARSDFGIYRLKFNPLSESLVSIEAQTTNKGKVFPVKKSDIVIKPLAHPGPGFDTQSQLSVAYPNVEIGSLLEIKFHLKRRIAPIPHFYGRQYNLGTYGLVEKYEETWVSPKPLYLEIKDPDMYLETSQTQNKIEIKLKKPLYFKALEENNAIYSPSSLVWIGVSNIQSWSEFPKTTLQYYENVITAPLPELYEAILNKAEKISTPSDQINFITSQLEEKIRYLGDWRLVKGAYHPRSLNEITKSGYGDCKDKSVSTASILRRLGYQAHVAVINRSEKHIRNPLRLPTNHFNHAIVWAFKDGREYWIDPTNFTSYVQRIYPDISHRQTIIFKPNEAIPTETPALDAATNKIESQLEFNFDDSQELQGKGTIQLLGAAANSITGKSLLDSKNQIDFMIAKWMTNINDLLEWKFDPFDLSSRIVSDFKTNFTFKARWKPITTSMGFAFLRYAREAIGNLNIPLKNRISSLFVSNPFSFSNTIDFVGKNMSMSKDLFCDGRSQWFDYQRDVKNYKDKITLKETLVIKQNIISIDDLKTPEFYQEQQKILTCMGDFALVFK